MTPIPVQGAFLDIAYKIGKYYGEINYKVYNQYAKRT